MFKKPFLEKVLSEFLRKKLIQVAWKKWFAANKGKISVNYVFGYLSAYFFFSPTGLSGIQ